MHAPFARNRSNWPPNYLEVWEWRLHRLEWLRIRPNFQLYALAYYAEHPVEFILDWVDTYDPRNAMAELPTRLPFVLFERQAQLIEFLMSCLTDQQPGLIDKSRDTGATWLCCAFSIWLWRFRPGASIGWGSRKEMLVDKLGDPDSIFEKLRMILRGLPELLLPRGFSLDEHCSYMKILNPENEATITGEAGDNIGRGGRKLIYFKDESAHYEHPESIEAALGDNTRVPIDISTPHGVGTVYDRKRQSGIIWTPGAEIPRGKTRVFVLDWSDHPAKSEEWHQEREQLAMDAGLLHVFRQEVDRDAAASVEGVVVPAAWARSAIDAHRKLSFKDDGLWSGALDVADEGGDLNALTLRKGVVLRIADSWGEGDTGMTTRRVIAACRDKTPINIQYDSVGVGSGVKSESNRLKMERDLPNGLRFFGWNGGASVLNPEKPIDPKDAKSPKNEDFFLNLKAQGWWALRRRFEKTHRAITEGLVFPSDELISLDSTIPKLTQLVRELSQPTVTYNSKMKMLIDKKPDGAMSPNLADSVMMNYFPIKTPWIIPETALEMAGPRRW